MKKILFGILVLLVLLTASVYFFIPETITVSSQIITTCSIGSAQRVTGSTDYRMKWFPKKAKVISPTEYILDECDYRFGADNSFNNNIDINYKNINAISMLSMLNSRDSLIITWGLNKESGYNPIKRISDYYALKHIKETNEEILSALKNFLISKRNVYGFDVNEKKQTDSTLISIKAFATHYPTTAEIYTNIEKLKNYATSNNAITTNEAMLNIENDGKGMWLYMVALPIDKALDNKGDIIAKRMFAGGKILITENITGGPAAISSALQNLEKYKTDNNYMSPAIPFQSLITDRIKESDTTKWKTKLYYPVY